MIKKELAKSIVVYRNLVEDTDKLIDVIKNSESKNVNYLNPDMDSYPCVNMSGLPDSGWKFWPYAGWKTVLLDPLKVECSCDGCISMKNFYDLDESDEKKFLQKMKEIYDIAFQDYLKTYYDSGMLPPYINNPTYNGPGWLADQQFAILKHKLPSDNVVNPNENLGNEALGWHLDTPDGWYGLDAGYRRIVTGNLYINDDYEGGELHFAYSDNINSEITNNENFKIVVYKPKAGDMILFPSTYPVFHSIQKTDGVHKYLVNAFMDYQYDGSMGEGLRKYTVPERDGFIMDMVRDAQRNGRVTFISSEELLN